MRYFLFGSCFLLLISCGRYPVLQKRERDEGPTPEQIRPVVDRSLYRCQVEGRVLFKRFALSGILLFKKTAADETHVVFQNEMGLSYFHFTWNDNDSFHVVNIIPQMNKPALIKTLRKDFELLLMIHPVSTPVSYYLSPEESPVMRLSLKKGFVDYSYTVNPDLWTSGILIDGRRKITTLHFTPSAAWAQLPDGISIKHHTAGFTIDLVKLDDQ